jgi:HEPN/RES N-terminal domain 1
MDCETYVCAECFVDYAVQAFVRANAVAAACDYCGRICENGSNAAPLSGVVALIEEGLEFDWAKCVDSTILDFDEPLPLLQSYHLLKGSSLGIESQTLFDDICGLMAQFQWCSRDVYGSTRDGSDYFDWQTFSELVIDKRSRTGHAGSDMTQAGNGPSGREREILERVSRTVIALDLVQTVSQGTFSSLISDGQQEPRSPGCQDGFSRTQLPICYEVRGDKGELESALHSRFQTSSEFEILSPFMVLDLNKLPDIPSPYDLKLSSHRWNIVFLNDFRHDLESMEKGSLHNHEYYLPLLVVTWYFRFSAPKPIAGLRWQSTRSPKSLCYVIF